MRTIVIPHHMDPIKTRSRFFNIQIVTNIASCVIFHIVVCAYDNKRVIYRYVVTQFLLFMMTGDEWRSTSFCFEYFFGSE